MGNDLQTISEDKLIKQLRKDFEKTINALAHKKTVLREYLTQLDDSKKVVCDESQNSALTEQAELYTREILLEVERLDPRFKCTFLQSGSFYDGVKVGQPDEYDYMAKLDLLSIPGTAKAVPTKLGFARLILEDYETIDLWEEFLCDEIDEDSKEVFKNVLTVSEVHSEFRSLVMKAIKIVEMPKKWQRDPCPEQHGPCTMLKFLVDDFLPEGQLYISIDLAPCITYPNYKDVDFPFYKNLKKESPFALLLSKIVRKERDVLLVPFINDGLKEVSRRIYHSSYREHLRVSFSLVEKDIFAHFAYNSIEKRVLRLLKILRDIHLRDDGKWPGWKTPPPDHPPSTVIEVDKAIRISPSKEPEWFWDYKNRRVPYEENELPIEKNDKSRDLLQTYIFKSLFFYMKLFSTNKKAWDRKHGSLLECLTECLVALFNIFSIPNATIPNFFFDGYTGQNPEHLDERKKILVGLLNTVTHLEKQTC